MAKVPTWTKENKINEVKAGDWIPVSVYSAILKISQPLLRDDFEKFGLKSKRGIGLMNKECDFFEFQTTAKFKKLFKGVLNWSKEKIDSLVAAIERKNIVLQKRKKEVKKAKTSTKVVKNNSSKKTASSKNNTPVPQNEEDNVFEFIHAEADLLSCCPRALNKFALKVVSSGYYPAA